ncbi:pirin family protein [Pontibacter harenae]|uniref:pirin family protein n=1 Tax=Pontibacter harenae TaxID=2894083 RepID=UPI001E301550|nr:pirin-like bicupin family protein [Pontibacter harenae]MCC9165532.1 pirin family protein [Pontibacter harenae]
MIKLITAAERHQASIDDWLKSNYLFSFADYYDPANVQFGPLRAFNDDYVAGKSGFPSHPHADMEIVMIVLSGTFTHKDSLGNDTTIAAGQVQRITAGTGITHSESNDTEDEAHLLQLWFLPNKRGLAPSYEHMPIDFLNADNKLIPLVTGQKVLEDVLYMNSNSTVYYANLKQGDEIDFRTFKIRKTLIYMLSGNCLINNLETEASDQVRLEDQEVVAIHATADSSFILVDVPALEVNY